MATARFLGVHLRALNNDFGSLKAAGEILSLSFTADPLIVWLYGNPSGARWGDLLPGEQKWQQHRVREYILKALVMEAVSNEPVPGRLGLCVLHPPGPQYRGLKPWWWRSYLTFYWDLWMNRPSENLLDEDRLKNLSSGHYEARDKIQARYRNKSLYYLEIVSVSPDSQGMGVGGKLMDWVINQVGDTPCFLECTNAANIPFYEKYDFKLVEEIQLRDRNDPGHQCPLYYMVRGKAPEALES